MTLVTSGRMEEILYAEGYEIVQAISVEAQRFERVVYVTRAPPLHRA